MRLMLSACAMVTACAAGGAEIRNVTAKQRYPWNGKVDISYTIVGDVAAEVTQSGEVAVLKVAAIDKTANTTNMATKLSGDVSVSEGTHSLVWDMCADELSFQSSNVVFQVYCETELLNPTYCIIDLSAGSSAASYPVTYLSEPPNGGFNVSEYKTTKLVLKRIEAGSFKMRGTCDVTLTKPFYCGLFEVTQRQWELVTGSNPCSSTSYGKGNSYPVHYVSYNMIRGNSAGAGWPASFTVDSSSFLGKLRVRTGLDFDLPTEAQWEYACRAGTTTTYSYDDSANGSYMWYSSNSSSKSHEVGTKSPNPWGLYDMHGNVWEWCLDWYASSLTGGTDPKGSSSGSHRVERGGSWSYDASRCASSNRDHYSPSDEYASGGFRLVRTLSE
ncbi:MAG: formylglycine-generating enzyme family protein [Kiritimatiellae bacterium]|nr:formylglycine-generating enzyme family protein [Kiritimatiellia bacterium]